MVARAAGPGSQGGRPWKPRQQALGSRALGTPLQMPCPLLCCAASSSIFVAAQALQSCMRARLPKARPPAPPGKLAWLSPQVMHSYEFEMRHPLRNMLMGQLVRSLLIQVRHGPHPGEARSFLATECACFPCSCPRSLASSKLTCAPLSTGCLLPWFSPACLLPTMSSCFPVAERLLPWHLLRLCL